MSSDGIRNIVDQVMKCVPKKQLAMRSYLRKCAHMAADLYAPSPTIQDNRLISSPAASSLINQNSPSLSNTVDDQDQQASPAISEANSVNSSLSVCSSPQEVAARLWLVMLRPDLVAELRGASFTFGIDERVLVILQRMISHGLLVPGERVQVDLYESTENSPVPSSNQSSPSLLSKKISTVMCMMDETIKALTDPTVIAAATSSVFELKLIQLLLTIATLPGHQMAASGSNLSSILSQLARMFVHSKHLVNQNTAKAALTQIILERVDDNELVDAFEDAPDGSVRCFMMPSSQTVILRWICRVLVGKEASIRMDQTTVLSSSTVLSVTAVEACPAQLEALLLQLLAQALDRNVSFVSAHVLTEDLLPVLLAMMSGTHIRAVSASSSKSTSSVDLQAALLLAEKRRLELVFEVMRVICTSEAVLKSGKCLVEVILMHCFGPSIKSPSLIFLQLAVDYCQRHVFNDSQRLMSLFMAFDCDPKTEPVVLHIVSFVSRIVNSVPDRSKGQSELIAGALQALRTFCRSADAWAVAPQDYNSTALVELRDRLQVVGDWRLKIEQVVHRFNQKSHDGIRLAMELDVLNLANPLNSSVLQEPRTDLSPHSILTGADFAKEQHSRLHPLTDQLSVQIAMFLRLTRGLSKAQIGLYLGAAANTQVLEAYVSSFDFSKLSFVDALRTFLESFRIPGEAQVIERFVEHFSRHFASSGSATDRHVLHRVAEFMLKRADENASSPTSANVEARVQDMLLQIAFSTIMLNTDMYSSNVRNKMSRPAFVKNSMGAICPRHIYETSTSPSFVKTADGCADEDGGYQSPKGKRSLVGGAAGSDHNHYIAASGDGNSINSSKTRRSLNTGIVPICVADLEMLLCQVYDDIANCEIQLQSDFVVHPMPLHARHVLPYTSCRQSEAVVLLLDHVLVAWSTSVGSVLDVVCRIPDLVAHQGNSSLNKSPSQHQSVDDWVGSLLDDYEVLSGIVLSVEDSKGSGSALQSLLHQFTKHPLVPTDGKDQGLHVSLLLHWVYSMSRRMASDLDSLSWLALLDFVVHWDLASCVDANHNIVYFDLESLSSKGVVSFISALASFSKKNLSELDPSNVVAKRATSLIRSYAGRIASLSSAQLERIMQRFAVIFFRVLAECTASTLVDVCLCRAAAAMVQKVLSEQIPMILHIPDEAFSLLLEAMGNLGLRLDSQDAATIDKASLMDGVGDVLKALVQLGQLLITSIAKGDGNDDQCAYQKLFDVLCVVVRIAQERSALEDCTHALHELMSMMKEHSSSLKASQWPLLWSFVLNPLLMVAANCRPGSATMRDWNVRSLSCVEDRIRIMVMEAVCEFCTEYCKELLTEEQRLMILLEHISTAAVMIESAVLPERSLNLLLSLMTKCLRMDNLGTVGAAFVSCLESIFEYYVPDGSVLDSQYDGLVQMMSNVCMSSNESCLDESSPGCALAIPLPKVDGVFQNSSTVHDEGMDSVCAAQIARSSIEAVQTDESKCDGDVVKSAKTGRVIEQSHFGRLARQCTMQLAFLDLTRNLFEPEDIKASNTNQSDSKSNVEIEEMGQRNSSAFDRGVCVRLLSITDVLRWNVLLRRSFEMACQFNGNISLRTAMVSCGFADHLDSLILARQEIVALTISMDVLSYMWRIDESSRCMGRWRSSDAGDNNQDLKENCDIVNADRSMELLEELWKTSVSVVERFAWLKDPSNGRRTGKSWTALVLVALSLWTELAGGRLTSDGHCLDASKVDIKGSDQLQWFVQKERRLQCLSLAVDVCAVCPRSSLVHTSARSFILFMA